MLDRTIVSQNSVTTKTIRVALMVALTAGTLSALTGEELRVQRLGTVADIWGRIYLFHPAVVLNDVDWQQTLVTALPRLEAAKTTGEFVRALNEHLLRPLNDPMTRAWLTEEKPAAAEDTVSRVLSRFLEPGVGYVDMRHPRAVGRPRAITDFLAAYKALGPVKTLVLDLRWADPSTEWFGTSFGLPLRFFTDTTVYAGPLLSRVHMGWEELGEPSVYAEKLQVANGSRIDPISHPDRTFGYFFHGVAQESLPTVRAQVVFVVNRVSYPSLYSYLDALQATRRQAVLLEKAGPEPASEYASLSYPEGIQFDFSSSCMLACNGGLDMQPDLVSPGVIPDEQLAERAQAALRNRQQARSASAAVPRMRYPARDTASAASLSRAERLLGLFKVWVVMRFLNPHLENASLSWADVLPTWIPRVEAETSLDGYYTALEELGGKLNDSHVSVKRSDDWPGEFVTPVEMARVEGRVIVGRVRSDSARALPVAPGDEILAINGRNIREYEAFWGPRVSASTPGARDRYLFLVGFGLRGARNSILSLVVNHANRPETLALKRTINQMALLTPSSETTCCRVLPGNIGYYDPSQVRTAAAAESAFKLLSRTAGLIIDNRGYPAVYGRAITAHLLDHAAWSQIDEIPVVVGGDTAVHGWLSSHNVVSPDTEPRLHQPLVVLINEKAQSSAEDFCICLRNARRATFVGSVTSGTDGITTYVYLPHGGSFRFTGMRCKYADGGRFQDVGIVPDVVATPTIAGIRAGRDEVLEKGIEVLNGLIAARRR